MSGNWRLRGACVTGGYDPELFFSSKTGDKYEARLVCRACPVRSMCLRAALREEGPGKEDEGPIHNLALRAGIRAGLTPKERWAIQYPEEAERLRQMTAERTAAKLAAMAPEERELYLEGKRMESRERRRKPEVKEGVKKRKAFKLLIAA